MNSIDSIMGMIATEAFESIAREELAHMRLAIATCVNCHRVRSAEKNKKVLCGSCVKRLKPARVIVTKPDGDLEVDRFWREANEQRETSGQRATTG